MWRDSLRKYGGSKMNSLVITIDAIPTGMLM